MHEVGMRLICIHVACCLKHGYSKPKCQNLHNVRLILYLFKELHKQASEFSSSGGSWCEIQHIFVIKLKLQVRLSMQSIHRYTLLMVEEKKNSIFVVKSGDAAKDVQRTLSYWWNQSKFCLAQQTFSNASMELHNIIPIAGLPYLAYNNMNPAIVNSMMLRSSMLAFEEVYNWITDWPT